MTEKKFEVSFKKLEKIVERLEQGELELEDALKLYEEGIALSRFCTKKLEEAEKKVKMLSQNEDGSFAVSGFEPDENSGISDDEPAIENKND